MSSSIETLQSDLEKLILKFQADQHYYLSGDYLEAQARVDFITALPGILLQRDFQRLSGLLSGNFPHPHPSHRSWILL